MSQAGEEPVGRSCQLSDQVAVDISEDSDNGELVNDVTDGVNRVPLVQNELEGAALWIYQIMRSVFEGNWEATQNIYKKHNLDINASITQCGQSILHSAVLTGHVDYVKQLIQEMSDEGINRTGGLGYSALHLAVLGGVKAITQAIVDRNVGLLMTRGSDGNLPLRSAGLLNHKDMASYLYGESKHELLEKDLADFCTSLIAGGGYDYALSILNDNWQCLATCKNTSKATVIHEMAKNPDFMASTNSVRFSVRRFFNQFAGVLNFEKTHKKRLHRSARELLVCMCERISSLNSREIDNLFGDKWDPLFIAADKGNVKFLKIFIRTFPHTLYMTNKEGQTIFHIAVLNRHEEIFKLIHDIGPVKTLVGWTQDNYENLLTHMAVKLAPLSKLNVVPGAALQLQSELIWFQEVKKVVPSRLASDKNKSGQTADEDVFMENHQDLIRRGEEWMRNTASSCLIVATLVATVVFTAVFTAPGGYNQTTGFPVFLTIASFQIFLVADAISLIFSVLSILTFLSVLTSTYQLKDFVRSLPAKLLFGLTTLFVSITAMMVAFVTVFFVYFKHHHLLAYALPMAILASVPIWWFIGSHARLFVNVMKSVLNSSFRPNYKDPLFPAPKKNKSA